MAEQKTWTQEEFKKEYGPFEKPLDLPKGAVITEVTSKNGQITFKYTYERTDKFAQYMEQREAISSQLPEGSEIVSMRQTKEGEYEVQYKLFTPETIPESIQPQVQAGKEFKSKYVGEIKGFTYSRKSKTYTPYTTGTPITQSDLLLVATVAVPFISPVIGGLSAKTLVAGALKGITVGEVYSYATVGEPMKYEQFVQSAFIGEAMPVISGFLSDVAKPLASGVYKKVVPSHARYVLSQKVQALKMRTTIPFYQKVISPVQLRLEHIYHEAIYRTPKRLGIRFFGPQRYGEVQAVLRTPFGTYESFDYPFPWKATPLSQYGAWLEMKHAFTMARRGLEKSLTWDIGLAPGYPVSAEKILATIPEGQKIPSLTLEEKMQQAERIPIYKTELTQRMSIIDGELKRSIYTWSTPTGDKTIFTRRGAFEFEQATQMDLPSRLFVPKPPTASATTWPSFRGIPSTPFDVTLQRAITKEVATGLGGLAFSQISTKIVKAVSYTHLTLPTKA